MWLHGYLLSIWMHVEYVEHTNIWLYCCLSFTVQIKALIKQKSISRHVKHIKAYNFLNNGPICNLLALLELPYSPLFNLHITFILMSNMLNRVQKTLLLFIHSNWMYVEHVKHRKANNFLNDGPICNLLALLELAYSSLFNRYISFILI